MSKNLRRHSQLEAALQPDGRRSREVTYENAPHRRRGGRWSSRGLRVDGRRVRAQGASATSPAMTADQAKEKNAYALGLQAYLWGFPCIITAPPLPRRSRSAALLSQRLSQIHRTEDRARTGLSLRPTTSPSTPMPKSTSPPSRSWWWCRRCPTRAGTSCSWAIRSTRSCATSAAPRARSRRLYPHRSRLRGRRARRHGAGEVSHAHRRRRRAYPGQGQRRSSARGRGATRFQAHAALGLSEARPDLQAARRAREDGAVREPARRPSIRYFDELGDAMRKRLPASADLGRHARGLVPPDWAERRQGLRMADTRRGHAARPCACGQGGARHHRCEVGGGRRDRQTAGSTRSPVDGRATIRRCARRSPSTT